ncbi:MAG: ParB/RepB/Spo0J family partition protein [bacterium]
MAQKKKPTRSRRTSATGASRGAEPASNPLSMLMETAAAEAAAADEGSQALTSAQASATAPWNRLHIQEGHNPRTDFRHIEELAATIASQGVVQPLLVEPHPERPRHYRVVTGERRWRALEFLVQRDELPEDHPVPVYLRPDLTDAQRVVVALVENLQRQDLSPLEEAEAFDRLRKAPFKLSVSKIAEAVGVSRRQVQFRLRLLRLSETARQALRDEEIPYVVARHLAGAPDALQDDALEHYRQAPPELQSEHGIRRYLQARAIPFERALFDDDLYVKKKNGPVFDNEHGQRYFLDRELFTELQRAALESRRKSLAREYEWVEVLDDYELPRGYREEPKGPGAVILIRGSLLDVEIVRGVRRVQPSVSASAPPQASPATPGPVSSEARSGAPVAQAPVSTPPPFVRPPSQLRAARAARARTRTLQQALASTPAAALRVAITSMLTDSPSGGARLELPPPDQRPELSGDLESALRGLAEILLGRGETPESLFVASLAEEDVYDRLLAASTSQLETWHRALVVYTTGAWYYPDRGPTPESSPLLLRLARDLGLSAGEWTPTLEYFEEFTLEELHSVAKDLGIQVRRSAKKPDVIRTLLESDRIKTYTPPEMFFRSS